MGEVATVAGQIHYQITIFENINKWILIRRIDIEIW